MAELFNEDASVEQPAIAQLQQLGWTFLDGDKISPESGERKSYRDVVLELRLSAALMKVNPWLSEENLQKAIRSLTILPQPTLVEANQLVYKAITDNISLEQNLGKGRRNHTVKVIDFNNAANNEFLVVSQFRINGPKQNIRPDLVLFVNGLPLAVIEAKSPYITNPIQEGINQLRRYANLRNPEETEGSERLFWYNQIMVATCRDKAVAGTISSSTTHYLSWHKFYADSEKVFGHLPSHQEVLIDAIFQPERF